MPSYPIHAKCKCCDCKCTPLGIHMELGDGLGSISIPFEEGVTHYEDEVEIDGPYSVLFNPDLDYQSSKENHYFLCAGYGEEYKLDRSTVYYFVLGNYVRAQERLKFEYNFDIDPETCKVTEGEFKVSSTVFKYVNNFRNGSWQLPAISSLAVVLDNPEVHPLCAAIDADTTGNVQCDWDQTPDELDYIVGDRWPCPCFLPYPVVIDIEEGDGSFGATYCTIGFAPDPATDEETSDGNVLLGHWTVNWTNKKYCNEDEDTDDFTIVNSFGDGWYIADPEVTCGGTCLVCCSFSYFSAPGLDRSEEVLKVKFYYGV